MARSAKKVRASKRTTGSSKKVSIGRGLTKSGTIMEISKVTGLNRREVKYVIETLGEVIELHLRKPGPGNFTLAGVAKFRRIHKPATKARKGTNPFTGEPTVFKAKPARNVIKIRPLKKLKDAVQ